MKSKYMRGQKGNGARRLGTRIFLMAILCGLTVCGAVLRFVGTDEKNEGFFRDAYAEDRDFTLWTGENVPSAKKRNIQTADVALSESENREEYVGFTMRYGAGIRLNQTTGIRFKAEVPESLAETVAASEDKSFGIVIAPAYYFEKAKQIAESDDGSCDYVNALSELVRLYGASPAVQLTCTPVAENGGWIIQGSIVNILYNNANLAYSAAAYVKILSESEETSYVYADYPDTDCVSMSRSVSYVATAALNDKAAGYGEKDLAILRGFVRRGVDKAAYLSESESQPLTQREISLSLSGPDKSLNIGDSLTLLPEATVKYSEEEMETGVLRTFTEFPFYWKSSDSDIISVSDEGVLTARSAGTATVFVYVGETEASCTVVCTAGVHYTCEIVDDSGYELLEIVSESSAVSKGDAFEATIRVRDPEVYGELSFWIDGKLYTTVNGIVLFSESIEADRTFRITDLSSSLDYFTISGVSVVAGKTNSKTGLPDKLILPVCAKDGKALNTIGNYAFFGTNQAAAYTNLRELTIPACYTSIVPSDPFKNCSALSVIYLNNTALATAAKGTIWTNCDALTKIYIPEGTLQTYSENQFWKVKASCLEEYSFADR